VVVFSTSPGKKAAVEALGARFINSSDASDMASVTGQSSSPSLCSPLRCS
jgi:hypothetical protein